jgi:hypothetical protein
LKVASIISVAKSAMAVVVKPAIPSREVRRIFMSGKVKS